MALMHNAIIRGLNSIYKQAPHVAPQDYPNFIGYALCWHEVLTSHHESEESNFFPTIEEAAGEKGIMDVNVEQHHAFLPGLASYKEYLTKAASAPSTFSGTELNALIDTFGPAVCTHLEDEIPSLLDLARFGDKVPLGPIMKVEGRKSGEGNSRTGGSMFYLLNIDTGFEDGLWKSWPPIPKIIKWGIIRVYSSWNSGFWKFASCDQNGELVELYALKD